MSLLWIFCLYLAERLIEVRLAEHNRRILESRGGREYYPASYRTIVALHALFWLFLLIEAYPWRVPFDGRTLTCLLGLAVLMCLRYWCITALGIFWNTRIMVVPGVEPVRRGPYRWLRHPNYLVVTLEFILLPLLMRAPVTLVVFSIANTFILRRRIVLEERCLSRAAGQGQTAAG